MAAIEQKGDMSSQNPIVSVLIPAYNAEKFIAAAVDSARRQTLRNIEIIICNDGSSDQTEMILKEIATIDPRVKVVNNSGNLGVSSTRNIMLQNACGRWIAFLDADDLMDSRRLETLVNLGNHHQVDVVIDNLIWINVDANKCVGPAVRIISENLPLSPTTFINRSSTIGFSWGYLQPIIRTNWIRQNEISFDSQLKIGEDFCFLCSCFIDGATGIFLPEPMYYYRISSQSATTLRENKGKYSFEQLITGTQKLLERAKFCGNAEAEAALHDRVEFLADMLVFSGIVDSMRTMDIASAVKGMMRLRFRFLKIFFYRVRQKLVWKLQWQFAKPFSLDH